MDVQIKVLYGVVPFFLDSMLEHFFLGGKKVKREKCI